MIPKGGLAWAAMAVTAGVLSCAVQVSPALAADGTASATPAFATVAMVPPPLRDGAAALPTPGTATVAGGGLRTSTLKAAPGDTLAGMLVGAGIRRAEAIAAIDALRKVFNPRRIKAGQAVVVSFRPAVNGTVPRKFMGLQITPDFDRRVRVTLGDDGSFSAREDTPPLRRGIALVTGEIQQSLYIAARGAGLPMPVLLDLIRVYSWDVDFQRDIQPGDRFEVMYERFHDEDGIKVHDGDIVFAALTLSGTRNTLYRLDGRPGRLEYFDSHGHSARKALMRTPIDGARLSSGYGRRRHPILRYNRMHRGIDFAAPRGTPIYAAGNGSVEVAGRNGAYGRYVRIRHNSEYKSAYAHMSRIAKGVRRGRRVKQGQVIGYVGSTGRSTGPHLHYEILRHNRQINPMRLRMPSGRKLKGDEMMRFEIVRTEIDRRVAGLSSANAVASTGDLTTAAGPTETPN